MLLDVGMQAAAVSKSRDANVLERTALDAAIAYHGKNMETAIRAGAAREIMRIHANLINVSSDVLAPAAAARQKGDLSDARYQQLVRLNTIATNESLSIDELNSRLDQFDHDVVTAAGDSTSPVLIVSAVTRASANYWYANLPQASLLHINLLDLALFSCTLDNPCPISNRDFLEADYLGASGGMLGSAYPCILSGPGWGLCVFWSTAGAAVGASVAKAVWDRYVGPDASGDTGGGSGGGGSTGGCPSGSYAMYSRGSTVCQRYTV